MGRAEPEPIRIVLYASAVERSPADSGAHFKFSDLRSRSVPVLLESKLRVRNLGRCDSGEQPLGSINLAPSSKFDREPQSDRYVIAIVRNRLVEGSENSWSVSGDSGRRNEQAPIAVIDNSPTLWLD